MNNNQVQHYIPQFILRKWENMAGEFAYFDKNGKRSELSEARKVFCVRGSHPYEIEKSLAKFECECAPIFKRLLSFSEKCGNSKKKFVEIVEQEYFPIIIFFILMEIRSKNTRDNVKDLNRDGLEEILLSDILELSKCRSQDDIKKSNIDNITKYRTLYEMKNYCIVLAETVNNDFILSSLYPVPFITPKPWDISDILLPPVLMFYPISPKRIIIFVDRERIINKNIYDKALLVRKDLLKYVNFSHLPIIKACDRDINAINKLSKQLATDGYIVKLK